MGVSSIKIPYPTLALALNTSISPIREHHNKRQSATEQFVDLAYIEMYLKAGRLFQPEKHIVSRSSSKNPEVKNIID